MQKNDSIAYDTVIEKIQKDKDTKIELNSHWAPVIKIIFQSTSIVMLK